MDRAAKPTYCTPEDVADTLDLPDREGDGTYGQFHFSDSSHPRISQVEKMILANEDIIDRRLRKSWRVNRVTNRQYSLSNYWRDINGWRMDYFVQGGDFIQLRKDILPWDPSQGDRLFIRTLTNHWIDISSWYADEPWNNSDVDEPEHLLLDGEHISNLVFPAFYFDYPMGKLYMRTKLFQRKTNAIRISYRWGSDGADVPYSIQRLCCLKTASQVLNMQIFNIKVGVGGDISGLKEATLRAWQEEMNEIWSSYQRSGSVHMLGGG